MKSFEKQAAQGDLLVTKITELPSNVKEMESNGSKYILGHSETGHNHVIDSARSKVYENPNNAFVLFVVVDELTSLDHLRSFDKHESLEFKPGIYKVNKQREYTPEGWRRAAD